tara:strand:+ start:1427 stop:2134 length:708 start_codon:yes stop_codon:yes gene_type:complete
MTLQAGDLVHLVDNVLEIDSYKSKMGDDANIITVSFSVKNKHAADDLNEFIEKGYNFVLDSDVTVGEQSDGMYRVFVEIERNKHAADNIFEIIDGVRKLSTVDDFRYRYYKNFRSEELTLENLTNDVPTDPDSYGITATESNLNNYKNFFNRSYLEESYMVGDKIIIKKAYAEPLSFDFIDFTTSKNLRIDEAFNVNAFAEILFLTKYLGDYNISKYGDKIVLENKSYALVVKRN